MSTVSSATQSSVLPTQTSQSKGYAYNDEYGFAHVVKDYETAMKYSGDGNIYSYEGKFGGGYALDKEGERASLALPDTKPYGNDVEEGHTPQKAEGSFSLYKQFSQMNAENTTAFLNLNNSDDEMKQYLAQIQLDLIAEKSKQTY